MMMTAIPTPKQVANDDYLFAKHFLKVLGKDNRLVPLIYNDIQLRIHHGRGRRNLVVKHRQPGVSTYVQSRAGRLSMTGACRVITMADKMDNTLKLRRMQDRFYDNLPDGFKPLRGEASASMTTYPLLNSEVAIMTAGGKGGSGRAGTASFLHGSECAYWKDADMVLPTVLNSMPPDGEVWLESTANGAQGRFYELVMEAIDGNPMYTLHFFRWFDDPSCRIALDYPDEIGSLEPDEKELIKLYNLDLEQIKYRRFRRDQNRHLFLQDYPESIETCFLTSGGGYFGNLSDAIYKAPLDAQPIGDHSYIAGLDFGQSNDYTVLCVVDTITGCQVDMLRINRMAWELQYQQIANVCKRWGIWAIMADSTGMQQAQIQRLSDVLYEHGLEVTVQGYPFDTKSKPLLISGLHEALYHGHIILQNHPVQRQEFTQFIAKQSTTGHWQYTAPSGAHDDTVIAVALALYATRIVTRGHEAVLI